MTPKQEAKKRGKVDWAAVERDYRAGNFTLRELGEKYGCTHAAIGKQVKKHGWTQDLSKAVKAATNAKLIEEAVTREVANSSQAVTNTVLAAAEVNKQVILQHRGDIREARDALADLLAELRNGALLAEEQELLAQILAGDGAEPKDEAEARRVVSKAIGLGNRVASIKALAEAMTKLQAAERKAFGLDEEDDKAGVRVIVKDLTGRNRSVDASG
jgi:hypothetical protein